MTVADQQISKNGAVQQDAGGRFWLDITKVTNLSDLNLETFDVIAVNGVEYELQGERKSDGWWWIKPWISDPDLEAEDEDPRKVIDALGSGS